MILWHFLLLRMLIPQLKIDYSSFQTRGRVLFDMQTSVSLVYNPSNVSFPFIKYQTRVVFLYYFYRDFIIAFGPYSYLANSFPTFTGYLVTRFEERRSAWTLCQYCLLLLCTARSKLFRLSIYWILSSLLCVASFHFNNFFCMAHMLFHRFHNSVFVFCVPYYYSQLWLCVWGSWIYSLGFLQFPQSLHRNYQYMIFHCQCATNFILCHKFVRYIFSIILCKAYVGDFYCFDIFRLNRWLNLDWPR